MSITQAAFQTLKEFVSKPRTFILHNATDEDIQLAYGGETRTIPAANKVVAPHPKFSDVCASAKDRNGKLIPGTLVIADLFEKNELSGEEVPIWSAGNMIRHTLGIDPKTGAANGNYAQRGVSVIPDGASDEVMYQIMKAGQDRFRQWRLKQAKDVINSHDEKNSIRQKLNMPQIPGGEEYSNAVLLIRAAMENEKEKLKAVFKDIAPPAQMVPEAMEKPEPPEISLSQQLAEQVDALETPSADLGRVAEQLAQSHIKPIKGK